MTPNDNPGSYLYEWVPAKEGREGYFKPRQVAYFATLDPTPTWADWLMLGVTLGGVLCLGALAIFALDCWLGVT